MSIFDLNLLKSQLAGSFVKDLVFFESIASTNKTALELAFAGAPEGTAVLADEQRAGRGRLGRSWHSPPGKNIYTSVILRPDILPAMASQITLVAGVAVAGLLERYCPGRITLKWPNDVLANGRKICGILAESRISAGKVDYIVVGIGINVNLESADLSEEIRDIATSVKIEAGAEVSREEAAAGLYRGLGKWYALYLAEGFEKIRGKWLECSGMAGKEITCSSPQGALRGTVVGMDSEGALEVSVNGEIRTLIAGEIFIRPGEAGDQDRGKR